MKLDTVEGRIEAAKRVARNLNEQWQEEFFPIVYPLFQQLTKPNKPGTYVQLMARQGTTQKCQLESFKMYEVEITCCPTVKYATSYQEQQALFGETGRVLAFDSLKRQVLLECRKVLEEAGYQPSLTKSDFLGQTKKDYGDNIYGGLSMSTIEILQVDDPGNKGDISREPGIGFVAYLNMSLWLEQVKPVLQLSIKNTTSKPDALLT